MFFLDVPLLSSYAFRPTHFHGPQPALSCSHCWTIRLQTPGRIVSGFKSGTCAKIVVICSFSSLAKNSARIITLEDRILPFAGVDMPNASREDVNMQVTLTKDVQKSFIAREGAKPAATQMPSEVVRDALRDFRRRMTRLELDSQGAGGIASARGARETPAFDRKPL